MDSIKAEMPKYQCHKEVWALKIESIQRLPECEWSITPADSRYSSFKVPMDYIDKHNPQPGGYYVVYQDGYKSYSPAQAFESGYTKVEAA